MPVFTSRTRLLNPAANASLEFICLKCLEKKPEYRYGSAAELAADLRRWLNHEPVVVPPCVDLAALIPLVGGMDSAALAQAKRRTRLVLFVGRLIAEKGADQFVAACTTALASLPGWRAEIIGGSN